MGQAQSGLSDDSDEPVVRSKKGSKKQLSKKQSKKAPAKPEKKSKKAAAPPPKKGKKERKKKISESSEHSEPESDIESDVESECPSSFLGDSDGGAIEEDDDSGLGSGKPITYENSMFTAFGNFSVDLSCTVGTAYLERYQLAPGQTVDYDQNQHKDLITEVKNWFPFDHKPSGSALAVSRVINWIVRESTMNVVTLGGTVGNDDNGNLINSTVENYGIKSLIKKNGIASTAATVTLKVGTKTVHPTVVTKQSVAGSAFKLIDYNEMDTPSFLNSSVVVYLSGDFVASSPEATLEIARCAVEKGKVVAISLGSTVICQFHKQTILQLLQYVDYVFANEDQILTLARETGIKDSNDLEKSTQAISRMPKINSSRRRLVICQNGESSCILAQGYNKIRYFEGTEENTASLDGENVFEAFVGGFLSQIIQGGSLEDGIEVGYRTASVYSANKDAIFKEACLYGKVEIEEEEEEEEDEEDEEEEGEEDEAEDDDDDDDEDDSDAENDSDEEDEDSAEEEEDDEDDDEPEESDDDVVEESENEESEEEEEEEGDDDEESDADESEEEEESEDDSEEESDEDSSD